jgi:histidinol-phosphate/aromatic aminotransferase/cobyric acid decarboxylase-like protein
VSGAAGDTGVDLHHHGDRDVTPGLTDLAVNVRLPAPPPWLADVIAGSLRDLGRYPDPAPACWPVREKAPGSRRKPSSRRRR